MARKSENRPLAKRARAARTANTIAGGHAQGAWLYHGVGAQNGGPTGALPRPVIRQMVLDPRDGAPAGGGERRPHRADGLPLTDIGRAGKAARPPASPGRDGRKAAR